MPQNRSSRRRRGSPYLFMLLAALLLLGLVIIGAHALNTWDTYRAESAVTPVPTATVAPISVTADPDRPLTASAAPAPTAVSHTAAPAPTPGNLAKGSKGEPVERLQTRLQELGYYTGAIDGDFGGGTQRAVEVFQRQNGLDADGIAGQKTLAALYSDAAKPISFYDTLNTDQPILVNKWHPLPDDFEPADLVTVKDLAGDLLLYDDEKFQGVREAVEALIDMIRAAEADGVTPWKVGGAYRTIADQKRIFNNRVNQYMNGEEALTKAQATSRTRLTVADPGCSEHHTGLAFDLNVPGRYFVDTAQYIWLKQHCWDYGFIMRYTDEKEDITGIIGEEWHVRYVGLDHAKKIQELGYCLEEYIDWLNQQ